MVAVAGDDRVALLERHLHADDDRFLPDVEVAEAADQPHAVHLAGLLLEAPDQQHLAVGGKFLFLGEFGDRRLASVFAACICRARAWLGQVWSWRRPYFSPDDGRLVWPIAEIGGARKRAQGNAQEAARFCTAKVFAADAAVPPERRSAAIYCLSGQDQVARMGVVEHRAGALVEQIGVELVGAQQRHAVLPLLALGGDALEFAHQVALLLREVLLGLQPVRAGVGREPEIADDQRRDRVEAEGRQHGAQAGAGDHAGSMVGAR